MINLYTVNCTHNSTCLVSAHVFSIIIYVYILYFRTAVANEIARQVSNKKILRLDQALAECSQRLDNNCIVKFINFADCQLKWPQEEADDYHSDSNKRKMAQAIPLNDEVFETSTFARLVIRQFSN